MASYQKRIRALASFAYGLWRIKELEEEWQKRRRRGSSGGKRKLMFYN
jgi:hypothetical protein